MPVPNYGVWAAVTPTSFRAERESEDEKTPHIYLQFKEGFDSLIQYKAAINVKSISKDSRLVYWLVDNLEKNITDRLNELQCGFHTISPNQALGLDYTDSFLIDIKKGKLIEHDRPGPDDDIIDKIVPIIKEAIRSKGTKVYIYGSQYQGRNGDGIHDIHMNQGSLPEFDNGVRQDGAIFFYFPIEDHWKAIFLAFASQRIPTDKESGEPLKKSKSLAEILGNRQ
ncbi:hypothetical protein EC973_006743 [Apophysomyces ossiformis]|uniref:DUF2278 family protein n=1 Tax=Apophysomyces ossiformis TaxID=679940 RepID=A0A8H7EKP4_9FUNG|nr:hypothetical protein EC973_006743 [Apophysomyces ossiformis]